MNQPGRPFLDFSWSFGEAADPFWDGIVFLDVAPNFRPAITLGF